jgi:hypothetical protein
MDYQDGIAEQLTDADHLLERVAAAIDQVPNQGGHVAGVRVAFARSPPPIRA